MGHVRLGLLPRTRAWKEVVGLIAAGADVSQIANATITAAEKAFSFVMKDVGYTEAVWLMTQMAIAAKKPDIHQHLAAAGIHLPAEPSLVDVTTAISPLRGRVACVKAVFLTNMQPETRVNARDGAAASFAETENGREQRTENRPKRGHPGQRRPSQQGPNPRQHRGKRAKKNQPRTVGF